MVIIRKLLWIINTPCEVNEFCPIDPHKIFSNNVLDEYCIPKSTNPVLAKRYPGEDCLKNEDCVSSISTCFEGKCIGQELNEPCAKTDECVVGLYCLNNICKNQLKNIGDSCVDDYQCKNDQACYNNKCIK